MSSSAPIAGVTFDFWNTLVVEDNGQSRDYRLAAWVELLGPFGIDGPAIDAAFERSWETFQTQWRDNRQFRPADAVALITNWLDVPDDPELRAELVHSFAHAADGAELELTPNVAGALRVLDDAGVRLGIICDVGMSPSTTLRAHLAGHGVLDHFYHWSFSDEVGAYKPSTEIFAHALDGLGTEPAVTAHVGDLPRTDVAGAKAAGLTAVLYTGVGRGKGAAGDSPEDVEVAADHEIDDHADLPRVLGVT